MPIRLASDEAQILRCLEVLRELRPQLEDPQEFLFQVARQRAQGFELALLEQDGRGVTVAGFRVQEMLVSGRTLYVDELVTAAAARSQGHGKAMLDWLIATARERGCQTLSLDSGTHRGEAHAFYFREGLRVTAFHFALPLG